MDTKVLSCFDTEQGKLLLKSVENCIEDNHMWEQIKQGVLLGFSGGADSVFLALVFMRLKLGVEDFPLVLCHVHHGIRKEGADRDLAFCTAFAKTFHLEISVSHADVPSIARTRGIGIEECAREIRYSEFKKIIEGRNDISCVATAHNATDNLETVLHRLLRGAGTRGLCGISAVRDNILRPILYVPKKDIVSFLDQNEIEYMTDETNTDIRYTRNFIRNEILPDLERIVPDPEVSILRFVQNLKEDEECLCDLAQSFLSAQRLPYVNQNDFSKLPRAIQFRVLDHMARDISPAFMLQRAQIDLILDSVLKCERTRISLSRDLYFVIERERIYFTNATSHTQQKEILPFNQTVYSPYFEAYFLLCDRAAFETSKNVHKNSISVSLSSAIINGDVYIRTKQSKDSYRVRKMTRKLKTLYQSLHLPTPVLEKIPVVCDGSGILYVPPFGVREDGGSEEIQNNSYYLIINCKDGNKAPWQD